MSNSLTGRGAAYRQRVQDRAEKFEVTLPSGAVFLLRRPNLAAFTMSGALPVQMAVKLQKAQAGGLNEQAAFATLDEAEQVRMVEVSRQIILQIVVEPRIVQNPQNDDEIGLVDLDPDDLKFLVRWANSGGGAAAEAEKFRGGPKSAAVAGADGQK